MEDQVKVLIVEDDADINNLICETLTKHGLKCTQAYSGSEGLLNFKNDKFDLAILDLMMPGMSGESLTATIRETSKIPIIVVSAKCSTDSRVDLLSMGADDFLSKPFSQPELLAKVQSLLRRYQQYRGKPASSIWTDGTLEVNLNTRMVRNKGETVPLTDTEYSILECLVKNRGRTVTTQELYETVWNEKFLPGSGNTIMVHVLNLRRKIEEVPSSPKIVRTVWGRGYQID